MIACFHKDFYHLRRIDRSILAGSVLPIPADYKGDESKYKSFLTLSTDYTFPYGDSLIVTVEHLLPKYSIYENVELPLLLLKMQAAERKIKILKFLEWVGLEIK